MAGPKIEEARSGARDFAHDALSSGHAVGLIRFASSSQMLCRPTTDPDVIEAALTDLFASGSTDMKTAIEMATAELSPLPGARTIVVVTDGKPNDPEGTLKVAGEARAKGIQIITIGTMDAALGFLKQLASASDLAVETSAERLRDAISSATQLLPDRTDH
jgi:Mg-chelatase subunit ChlD